MYLESEINGQLESLRKKFVDKSIDFKNVRLWLEKSLKKYKVKINIEDNPELEDCFCINAFYGEDLYGHEIEVCIVKNPDNHFLYIPTNEDFDTFLFYISQAVQHELIHKYQWFMREYDTIEPQKYKSKEKDPKIRKAQEYLGHTDEIDARANDLWLEIKHAKKDINCLTSLKDLVKDSDTLTGYIATFGDSDHKVVKRLLTRTWKYAKAV